MNSYGFNGSIPSKAIAGVYDSINGEWTGVFFSNEEDAKAEDQRIADDDALSVEAVNDSNWVSSK